MGKTEGYEHLCTGVAWFHYAQTTEDSSRMAELFVEDLMVADIVLDKDRYFVWREGDPDFPSQFFASFTEAKASAEEALPELVRMALLEANLPARESSDG